MAYGEDHTGAKSSHKSFRANFQMTDMKTCLQTLDSATRSNRNLPQMIELNQLVLLCDNK